MIKLIAPQDSNVDHELSRLRSTASLSHPHLIRTIEVGRSQIAGDTVLYVVMESADDDLSQVLPQRALEPGEATELLPPLIDALSYLHGRGFVHGDIRPSNVLAVGNQLKLSADSAHSAANKNSPRRRRDSYDAPETAAGISLPEGDVWSVGATLVASFTQDAALADAGAPGGGLPERIPEPFRGIARECLHLDPKRRCSLAQIQARMQPEGRSVPLESEPELPPPTRSYRYSWRMFIPIAVLIVLGIGVALYRVVFPPKPARSPESQVPEFQVAVTEPPKAETPPPAAKANPAVQPTAPPSTQPEPAKASTSGAVLHEVVPQVPKSAQNTITGTIKVTVHVQVDSSGKVTSAKFKSSGSSRYFANQAMKAAERWEFTPPQVGGQPTASNWLLQFRFKRTSIQASSQQVKR